MATIPNPTKSRTWDLGTSANGTFFDTEFNQLYANDNDLDGRVEALEAVNGSVLWVRDEKASGSASQALTATTWNKRDLGTTKVNTISGASVASSVVTLPAGTYEATAFALSSNSITDSTGHQIRIYNTSDSALLAQGSSARLNTLNTAQNASVIQNSRFTLAATKNIELQHWTSAANNGGSPVTSGSVEVYSELFIRKVA